MRTWVEISKKALEHNIGELYRVIQKPMWLIVKSNFYGHGDIILKSKILNHKSIIGYGVSSGEEAIVLRNIAPHARIAIFSDSSDVSFNDLAHHTIEVSLTGWDMVEQLKKYSGKNLLVHIKIETGLNRFGFAVNDIPKLKTELSKLPVTLAGIYSHFSAVEEGYYRFAQHQLDTFLWGAHALDANHQFEWHMAATAAAIELPDSRLDSVRCGIGIYGLSPSSRLIKNGSSIAFKPVLTWKTQIVAVRRVRVGDTIGYGNTYKVVKPMTIAVLPVGYADGFDRRLSNKGAVLIGGARCPIIGRVFMNTTVVDITQNPDIVGQGFGGGVGDEVALIGKQGSEEISADEVARSIGTISYEVITKINWQIPRITV